MSGFHLIIVCYDDYKDSILDIFDTHSVTLGIGWGHLEYGWMN